MLNILYFMFFRICRWLKYKMFVIGVYVLVFLIEVKIWIIFDDVELFK